MFLCVRLSGSDLYIKVLRAVFCLVPVFSCCEGIARCASEASKGLYRGCVSGLQGKKNCQFEIEGTQRELCQKRVAEKED